ncbi:MAG: ABC transporter ATP-binding protein [Rhizobiaceae bacterium]
MTSTAIEFKAVLKTFRDGEKPAVDKVDLAIDAGTTTALIGPSGCGKTTSLKMINRLVEPTSGEILIDGRSIRDMPVLQLRRSLGYVIQHVGLFPHMTIARNIAVVPQLLGWDRKRITERVDALLDLVGLDPDEYRQRRPSQLSGGQQQRVGVARALAADPPILLMDEPFGALDPITRANLQHEITDIQQKLRKTIVIVTHDMDEAVKLADRIVVMEHGRVVQTATPADLLLRPATPFVASLLGEDRIVKLLQTTPVERLSELGAEVDAHSPTIGLEASMHHALTVFLQTGAAQLRVENAKGVSVGALRREVMFEFASSEQRNASCA